MDAYTSFAFAVLGLAPWAAFFGLSWWNKR
jgi:hypothetical protein